MVVAYRIAADHPYCAGGGGATLLDGPAAMGGAGTLMGKPVAGDNAGAAVGIGAGGAEVLIGTVSFWPILRKSEVSPLIDFRLATLVRYLSAMWPSVSPLFTVYTLGASGTGIATVGLGVAAGMMSFCPIRNRVETTFGFALPTAFIPTPYLRPME